VPGTATGRALVSEIPGVGSAGLPPGAAAGLPKDMEVLYPASALASSTVPDGLAAKGYRVTRLSTYSTRPTEWGAREAEAVRLVDVVTFAAPSAVKSWVRNVGVDAQTRVACIGETSAAAAVSAGFSASHVFFPDEPGMRGWVAAVGDAIESTS
jgi:uroporphyrinogen-III synthase